MPKHAHALLVWSAEWKTYALHEDNQTTVLDAAAWSRWLDDHASFAFHGRNGRLNLLKERRKAGPGYWYAYRRQSGRVAKRYAGRGSELTFAHLEELASALDTGSEQVGVPQPSTTIISKADTRSFIAAGPLLAPKLQPPRLHSSLVRRGRLLAQLDAGRERKLTLLNAPAGFGKTTLVRQWLQHITDANDSPTSRVAWLALDGSDNDPLRFWRYVITACRAFGSDVGVQSLAPLEALIAIKSPLDMILTVFINELAQIPHASILVLEDYHLITAPQIHDAVGLLLDHLPPHLHLLIISRAHPPLPLARLAAAGELTEIEASALRFSDAETAAFLDQTTAVALQPDEIALVKSRLEGWAAGLRLLTLALEGRDTNDIGSILAHFIAGRRGIGEYFVAEVLHHQPVPLQLFLLQTSFLVRLTASLCDSVTGSSDSQAMIDALYQANLFLEPLDASGLWYRYHTLFATAMQSAARRRLGDAAVRSLLERAGSWYEVHAFMAEAIEAAFSAADPQRAADLIERVAGHQFNVERPEIHSPPEFYTLQNWLTRLPKHIVDERPLLNLSLAVAMLFTTIVSMQPLDSGASSEIERLLSRADQGFRAAGEMGLLGYVFAFRSQMARERGEIAAAVRWAGAALEALPPTELNWRSVCISTLGGGEYTAGRLRNASMMFVEARAMCERIGNRSLVRATNVMQGWVLLEQNELQRATPLFHQALAEARAIGDLDDTAHALHGLAEVALCEHDLDVAWAQASEIVEAMHSFPHQSHYVQAALILARVEQARSDSAAALARCAALLNGREAASMPADKLLVAQILDEQARIAMSAGDMAAVRRWRDTHLTDLELPRAQRDHEELLLARLLAAEGDPAAATQIFEPLLAAAEADGCERIALELRIPLALALAATGRADDARHTLTVALASAQPANAQHVLVAEGETLVPLLRATLSILADKGVLAFAKIVLHHLAPARASTATALLSPQERRVLRLVAAGRSNTEIATDLVVSVNTVKVHVKSIYRKLDVTNRLEAASVARNLDLR